MDSDGFCSFTPPNGEFTVSATSSGDSENRMYLQKKVFKYAAINGPVQKLKFPSRLNELTLGIIEKCPPSFGDWGGRFGNQPFVV